MDASKEGRGFIPGPVVPPGDGRPQEAPSPKPTGVVHDLKTWPPAFAAIRAGLKPWEYRYNDRNYRVGDLLRLGEWNPETETWTGQTEERLVAWVLEGGVYGIPAGYAILTLAPGPFAQPNPLDAVPRGEGFEALCDRIEAAISSWDSSKYRMAEHIAHALSPQTPAWTGGGEPDAGGACNPQGPPEGMTSADWLRACSAWLDQPDMRETIRRHLADIADELDTQEAGGGRGRGLRQDIEAIVLDHLQTLQREKGEPHFRKLASMAADQIIAIIKGGRGG